MDSAEDRAGERWFRGLDDDADDLWEPTDDPEYWDPSTGERAYQGNETALRWRIVTPSGVKIDVDGSDQPFETRDVAVTFAGSPHLRMKLKTFEKLRALAATVAGWAKITADGWTVEPMKPDA